MTSFEHRPLLHASAIIKSIGMKNMILDILKSNWANLFYILSLALTAITLLVLIQYASDTKILAVQSQESNLANLRPLIERTGIIDWKDIKFEVKDNVIIGKPLTFTVLKNVATNINGYIIDGYKYALLFGSSISQVATNTYGYYPAWGWMKPDTDTILSAVYLDDSKQKTSEPNQIYVSYADIEGNRYYTLDDASLSNPRSFRGSK